VVVSVPHSGCAYPEDFWQQASEDTDFSGLEDPFLDRLLPETEALGAPVVIARFGRAYVDVNRAPSEWDQAMFSERLPRRLVSDSGRVRAGLGTFPRYVPPRQLVNRYRLTVDQGIKRWLTGYRPYHRTLSHLLFACRARFGFSVLADLHSMPQLPGERLPDLVVGDGFGKACVTPVTQAATHAAQSAGLSVVRNYPYAGGYITQNYGVPGRGVHAIQLEFARPLYMNETTRVMKAEQGSVTRAVAAVIEEIGALDPALLRPTPTAMAGED